MTVNRRDLKDLIPKSHAVQVALCLARDFNFIFIQIIEKIHQILLRSIKDNLFIFTQVEYLPNLGIHSISFPGQFSPSEYIFHKEIRIENNFNNLSLTRLL